MSRRRARELALRALFAVDVGRIGPQRALTHLLELGEEALPPRARAFAAEVVTGAWRARDELDRCIAQHAVGWSLERMANIDRNILRLALFEILHRPDIPPGVSVNEAVELAKIYGDADSPRFINGILGQVLRDLGLAPAAGNPDRGPRARGPAGGADETPLGPRS